MEKFVAAEFKRSSAKDCQTLEDLDLWRIEEKARLDAWHDLELQAIHAWADCAARKNNAWFYKTMGAWLIPCGVVSFGSALYLAGAVPAIASAVYLILGFFCLYKYDSIDETLYDPRT